jgi:DNA polymerase-1
MLNFESLLCALQEEGLFLAQADQSQNTEVKHALTSNVNQKSIANFYEMQRYLAPYPITVINDNQTAQRIVLTLKTSILLGIDIETSKRVNHPKAGLHPKLSHIRLVQLFDGQSIYIFDCLKLGGVNWIESLKDNHLIAHNACFEAQHFFHAGITFSNLDCSMLMGRVFKNENLSLKDVAKNAFTLNVDKTLQTSNWGRENLLPEQLLYAALDSVITYQLYDVYQSWFCDYPHYVNTYEFLKALVYPLVRQLSHGVLIDIEAHQKIIDEWEHQLEECKQILKDEGLLNLRSFAQKQVYLSQKLSEDELEAWPKTKKGQLKTDKNALMSLAHHTTLNTLATWNTVAHRLANFGMKLREQLVEGELYPGYMIAGTFTGRFTCSEPNIQNQPRSGFKHIYIAPNGWKFVTGDLAQVELRVAGLISGDPVIIDAYANGKDLHKMMAAKMTGKPEDHITKEERTAAKGVNFGLLFGGGAKSLQDYVKTSYGVDMTLDEAKLAKESFHALYKIFTLWQKGIVKHTNQYDESESIYCRLTRHYSYADHLRDGVYSDIYTHAINYPIQSTAWEIIALAICFIDKHLPDDGSIRVSHHVYDELCLCARDDQVLNAEKLLLEAFQQAYLTIFPNCNIDGIIEVGSGQNWAQAAG